MLLSPVAAWQLQQDAANVPTGDSEEVAQLKQERDDTNVALLSVQQELSKVQKQLAAAKEGTEDSHEEDMAKLKRQLESTQKECQELRMDADQVLTSGCSGS